MFRKNISKDEINRLPLRSFQGKIVLISNQNKLKGVFEEVYQQEVVGFDTETRPSFKKGETYQVSLIQIAMPEKVFLIRLQYTGFCEEIRNFLNSNVKKAGVGLRDDMAALARMGTFKPNRFIGLNKVADEAGIEASGLRKLTAILLGFRISKSQQTSNWDRKILTGKQLKYAATDAWCCLQIFRKLQLIQSQ